MLEVYMSQLDARRHGSMEPSLGPRIYTNLQLKKIRIFFNSVLKFIIETI